MSTHSVFVTGGTGYVGRPLIRELLARRHSVRALIRPGSAGKLPAGAAEILGDALDAASFESAIPPADTMIHLVGTPHPNPFKGRQFRDVDLASIRASVSAARKAAVQHLVYVSVAHPAPVMKAFIEVRKEGEAGVVASGLPATILRPWYILGPAHWWPYALVPFYKLLERQPWSRESALRLGLVRREQMVAALVLAVENPVQIVKIVEVPEIRSAQLAPVSY
ncbi:MAG TPA: NAD(P)H-binding protein [Candidatus Methylomirabilis sp.]|nr:NAD(P)H-binding protein [Candidatus Methylomirabilis sp.]